MKLRVTSKKSVNEQIISILREYVSPELPIEITGDEDDIHINLFNVVLTHDQINDIESQIDKVYLKYERVASLEINGDDV